MWKRLLDGVGLPVAAGLVVFALVAGAVARRALRYDFHTFDLGIYSQALAELSFDNPNPWLSVYASGLFNDHFDPILAFVAPVAKVADPMLAGLACETLVVAATGLLLVLMRERLGFGPRLASAAFAFLLLNRATINAIGYPIHPTTWAILPITGLFLSQALRSTWLELTSLLLLFSCKEEFPFVGIMVAAIHFYRRESRTGAVVAILSLGWIIFAFFVRPELVGAVTPHAERQLRLLAHPAATFARAVGGFPWYPLLLSLLPLVPLAAWLRVSGARSNAMWLLCTVPPLVIRFVNGAFENHYMAPVAALFLFAALPVPDTGSRRFEIGGRTQAAVFALLLLTSALPIARSLAELGGLGGRRWNAERQASIEAGLSELRAHPTEEALVTGNFTAALAGRGNVFTVGLLEPFATPEYYSEGNRRFRYLLVEKIADERQRSWPLEPDEYRARIERWRRLPETEVLIDDDFVLFARGWFDDAPGRFAPANAPDN